MPSTKCLFKCGTTSYARPLRIKHCETTRQRIDGTTPRPPIHHEVLLQARLNIVAGKKVFRGGFVVLLHWLCEVKGRQYEPSLRGIRIPCQTFACRVRYTRKRACPFDCLVSAPHLSRLEEVVTYTFLRVLHFHVCCFNLPRVKVCYLISWSSPSYKSHASFFTLKMSTTGFQVNVGQYTFQTMQFCVPGPAIGDKKSIEGPRKLSQGGKVHASRCRTSTYSRACFCFNQTFGGINASTSWKQQWLC